MTKRLIGILALLFAASALAMASTGAAPPVVPPEPGSWATLFAGVIGALSIARRRMS